MGLSYKKYLPSITISAGVLAVGCNRNDCAGRKSAVNVSILRTMLFNKTGIGELTGLLNRGHFNPMMWNNFPLNIDCFKALVNGSRKTGCLKSIYYLRLRVKSRSFSGTQPPLIGTASLLLRLI